MVHLTLQHRMKLGRQATLLSETSNEGRHAALFGLSAAIAVLNALFLIAGAVVAGIVDMSWYHGNGAPEFDPQRTWYKDTNIRAMKGKLFFFYCTIPFVLSPLSIYVALQHRRSSALRLALGTGACALVLWTVQFALQGRCMFGGDDLDFLYVQNSPGLCGFSLEKDWIPSSTWQTGLGVAMGTTWTIVVMLLLYVAYLALALILLMKQRRASGKPSKMPQAYAYHSAVEETEMQTDRDMPDRSAAPTPVPSEHAEARPPSYRSASAFHENLPREKEREMV